MKLPDFLFIGPDKAGSTWLYNLLRAHPSCYVPPIKDIYFFDRYFDRGLEWYASFFSEATPSQMCAEFSHDYLFSPQAAIRISDAIPTVKLLTCLRNPCDRSFSQYLFLLRSGTTNITFERAIEEYPEIIDNSMYFKHLSQYYAAFPASQILPLVFDDLEKSPSKFAKQALSFVNLSADLPLPYDERVLPAGQARLPILSRALKAGAEAARALRLERLVGRVKMNPYVQSALYRNFTSENRPRMADATRQHLIEQFVSEKDALESLTGRTLAHWYRI